MHAPEVSVIIPTYQEEHTIGKTLRSLISSAKGDSFEIIIADASPNEHTLSAVKALSLPQSLKDRLIMIKAPKGRARQMNEGAKHATGTILLFLHSDTLLPNGWNVLLYDRPPFDYGCFKKRFDEKGWFYTLNAAYTNLRCRITGYIMGDHALFVTRSAFDRVKGYRNMQIMEDVDLSLRLRGMRRTVIASPVITSARRFKTHGPLKTWYLMQKMKFLYFVGASDKTLAKIYS